MTVVQLIGVFTGLVMYAKYHDCDPFLAKVSEEKLENELEFLIKFERYRVLSFTDDKAA